jgi:large subunit ribosomal protein L10
MNRDQKAQVVDRIAADIEQADAVLALDYRGISVKQAAELRTALLEADASFRIVKNTLTERAADKAGAESLKELLDGPTALTFVRGDVALAAKAVATFRRREGVLDIKGGSLDGEPLSVDQIESIARLPARDVLHGQFVGVLASPVTGLVRGLASMISGLAVALRQIEEQGLVGAAPAAEAPATAEPEAPAEAGAAAEAPADAEQPAAGEAEQPAAEPEAAAAEPAPAEATAAAEAEAPAEAEASEAEAPAEAEPAAEAGASEAEAPAEAEAPVAGAEAGAAETAAESGAEQPSEAPGDPVAEAEKSEQATPSEGEESEEG